MTLSTNFCCHPKIVPPVTLVAFVLGLSFGCLSDPQDVDPPDDDDVGVEDDVDDGKEDAGEDADAEPCEPLSCDDEALEGQCGEFDDECGGMVDCGCGDYEVCDSADGESGQCVCISEWFCDDHGAECGRVPVPDDESCGDRQEVECGSCESPESCFEPDDIAEEELEGDVDDYICHCIAKDCGELGYDCGMMFDNCGNEINCDGGVDAPICGDDQNPECVDGQWECIGEDCVPDTTCADIECGTFTDECGEVQTCGDGACSEFQACNDAHNTCECDDELMENACGPEDCTIGDGECTFECVECTPNCVCENGDCESENVFGDLECQIL